MPEFNWHGDTLELLDHPYNTTIRNERAIEVPIGRKFIADHEGTGIEVGNVLGHYGPTDWTVIDRYEEAPGVENIDLFDIDGTYDWVLAISTVEHVGNWPGESGDPARAVDAVDHLFSLVAPGGAMLITVPFDQNPALDKAIVDFDLGADVSTTMLWSNSGWSETPGAVWGPRRLPNIWPSALWVGEWE